MDQPIRPRALPVGGTKPRVMMLTDQIGTQRWRCRGDGVATYGMDMDEAVRSWVAVHAARARAQAGQAFEVRL